MPDSYQNIPGYRLIQAKILSPRS